MNRWLYMLAFTWLSSAASAQTIVYVNAAATGANNGASWADAYTSLQTALTSAPTNSELWVAAGAYRPATAGGSRMSTFSMRATVSLYGGFAGTEVTREQRMPAVHITILSGDLAGDDAAEFSNYGENTYHVLTALNIGAATTLDGFTISGGNADSTSIHGVGGGLRTTGSSPTIHNCHFRDNSSRLGGGAIDATTGLAVVSSCRFTNNRSTVHDGNGGGGAIRVYQTFITLTDCAFEDNTTATNGGGVMITASGVSQIDRCTFVDNHADDYGGGVYATGNSSSNRAIIRRCEFHRNDADLGGGGVLLSRAPISDCTFADNQAGSQGGGCQANGNSSVVNCRFFGNRVADGQLVPGGGGLAAESNGSAPVLVANCLFIANTVQGNSASGGGARCRLGTNLHNCTFIGNTATGNNSRGGGMAMIGGGGSINAANCIVRGNSATTDSQLSGMLNVTYSNVQGGYAGTGNVDLVPQFVDLDGTDDLPGTVDDNARLLAVSPCIDAGANSGVPVDASDLDGDSNTTEATPRDLDRGFRLFDSPETPDSGNGNAPIVDMGCYEFSDCNSNGTDDGEDIRSGHSVDADGDGLPDECSVWVSGVGAWSNPANWEPPVVPNNDPMSGRVFTPLIQGIAAQSTLDTNVVIDTLYINARGTLLVSQGDLTIASPHTIVNNGNLVVGDAHAIIARVTFDLLGDSPVTLAGPTATLRSQDGVAAIVSHVPIEGQGIIQTPFVNAAAIEANTAGTTLQVTGTSALISNGALAATAGGTLWLQTSALPTIPLNCLMLARGGFIVVGRQQTRVSVSTCGPIDIEPGSPASIVVDNASLVGAESWTIGDAQSGPDMHTLMSLENDSLGVVNGVVRVRPNGTLNINSSTLMASSLVVEPGGTLIVASQVQLTDGMDWQGADATRWSWAAESVLLMEGGRRSCTTESWTSLEAASLDLGPTTGQGGNFELPTLTLAAAAAFMLHDERDNGHRNGPGGAAEAVYAAALVIGDDATLNLNGHHLYVAGTLMQAGPFGGGEIIDVPLPMPVIAGDMNADGRVDGDDVAEFVNARFAIHPPLRDLCAADANQNGELDDSDVQVFVLRLLD